MEEKSAIMEEKSAITGDDSFTEPLCGSLAELVSIRKEMHNDFPYFANKCLQIRSKEKGIIPFVLNRAQLFVHEKLEEQRKETGIVRAIILKGRQQGISTYVQGRFLEKLTYEQGKQAFIMTHEDKSTKEIFTLTKRFYDKLPDYFRPRSDKNSIRELAFNDLDSKYAVGTAGNANIGRGFTLQYFHGSEVAFYKRGEEITAGVINAVPDAPGTEIIFESTANGVNNIFKQYWDGAVSGENGFIAIFVPWYLQDEYRSKLPDDFEITDEEKELKTLYQLDDEQIYWRRRKIALSSLDKFKQEYPLNETEAFLDQSTECFISPFDIEKARHSTDVFKENRAPLLMGVDVARGGDRSVIVLRRGREVLEVHPFKNQTTTEVVGMVKKYIHDKHPDKVFIDVIGMGWAVYDPLIADGYGDVVVGVNVNERADEPDKYKNKKAEIWGRMKQWFEERPNKIPDDAALVADLTAVGTLPPDANGRLQIEDKQHVYKKIKRSPDLADALALTFSYLVSSFLLNVGSTAVWEQIRNRHEKPLYLW